MVTLNTFARQSVATYPPIAPGDTSYTVPASEASLIIGTLYLPKSFTLKFAPDVRSIDWTVSTISFEENATVDLSPSQAKPPRGKDGGSVGGQAGYCTVGAPGGGGFDGIAGLPGRDLTIRNVATLDALGSLWIRTDGGGPGGDGGNGGNGQLGGGHKSLREGLFKGGACDAASGGAGGRAGRGGSGGRTAKVNITFRNPGAPASPAAISPQCGATSRPPIATGRSSAIAIWGAAGCGGSNGVAGQPGGHG
jgi:hypothetical protein